MELKETSIQAWLPGYNPDEGKTDQPTAFNLYCLPYAGGGASLFRRWGEALSGVSRVYPVQLPGRETRRFEAAYDNLEGLVERLAQALEKSLSEAPAFGFFGYSMGGLIAFELTRYLAKHSALQPAVLFIAACRAPELINSGSPIYQLPDREFIQGLQERFGGLPEEVLAEPELLDLYTGLLRADMTVVESYNYRPGPPLACPIAAFGGQDDYAVSYAELKGWSRQTEVGFSLRMLPGGHLFIRSAEDQLLNHLRADLARLQQI
ncbi:MAG TPA: alpha/beta fold hydrolase [Chloroflexia bacterium]|nr:alpha/beta fold hydrolase [Chloroflexia bacterium]